MEHPTMQVGTVAEGGGGVGGSDILRRVPPWLPEVESRKGTAQLHATGHTAARRFGSLPGYRPGRGDLVGKRGSGRGGGAR
jgi:hypothetical protein